jgi:hypothetical protein
MKKNILIPVFLICILLNTQYSVGQDNYSVLNWNYGYPTGGLKDFIDKSSFRGFGIEIGRGINENIAIGISASWSVFYEALDYDTYFEGNLTISGKQYRYLNAFPILITGHYFISPGFKVNPYLAGGIGTYSMNQKAVIGLHSAEKNTWHFGLYPEAGVFFYLTDDFALNLAARYNYALKASEASSYSYLNLVLGFAFLY